MIFNIQKVKFYSKKQYKRTHLLLDFLYNKKLYRMWYHILIKKNNNYIKNVDNLILKYVNIVFPCIICINVVQKYIFML